MFQKPQVQNEPVTVITNQRLRHGKSRCQAVPCLVSFVCLFVFSYEQTGLYSQSTSVLPGCSVCRLCTISFSGIELGTFT